MKTVLIAALAAMCLLGGTPAWAAAVYSLEGTTLTVEVADGEATLDASQVAAGVSRIRKTGAGDLVATPMPSYTGDFAIDAGRFIVNQNGDFGADNVGTTYVNDGASLAYAKCDEIARGETIVFAGAPASGCLFKLGRLPYPSGYVETWKYFSNTKTKYRATDAAVVFGTAGKRFQMLGSYDANGRDLVCDQTMVTTSSTLQFNLGLAIVNAADVIVGRATNADGTAAKAGAQLLVEPSTFSLKSKTGASRLVVCSNPNGNISSYYPRKPVATDGNWTLVLENASLRTGVVSSWDDLETTRWNDRVEFTGANAGAAEWYGSDSITNYSVNLYGPVSGSGKLKVGPGWLNFVGTSANTYAGQVTVRGRTASKPFISDAGGIGLRQGAALFPQAASVTFTDEARLVVEKADLEAGVTRELSGRLVFSAGTTLAVSGLGTLAKAKEYVIARASSVEGAPLLAESPCAAGWALVTTATEVKLVRGGGFVFLIRGAKPAPPVTPENVRLVTFRRLDGTVLERLSVPVGATVTSIPEAPAEADFTFKAWDNVGRLQRVTEDVEVWALYESDVVRAPSTSIASKGIAERPDGEPLSLEEYFRLYSHLAWSDEFPGTELNRGTKSYSWSSTYTGGNWNYDLEERNNCLARPRENNCVVSNGCLWIDTRRETSGKYSFTSGGVKSNGKVAFKYGRCEVRARLCRSLGVWPAFWFMGSTGNWPKCGEIDMFEQLNGGAWIASTLHLPHPTEQYVTIENQGTCGPADDVFWADGFHRFGLIVNERELVFYTDNVIHKRIDIRDARYGLLRDRSQYIILGSGMGGTWTGITNATNVPAAFQSEDFVVDYCRIFTNETEGQSLSRTNVTASLSGPVSATVWKGWEMNWGHPGASAYQNDISTNGFTEAFFVNEAINQHVSRDRPDAIFLLTEPACKTGCENGNFWTNLQINVDGWTTAHVSANGDKSREQLLASVLYDARRFSASESAVGTLTFNDATMTNYVTVCADLVERGTGARVKLVGVTLAAPTTAAQLEPLYDYLNRQAGERVVVLFLGLSSAAYASMKSTAAAGLSEDYVLLGADDGACRRVYATGGGTAATPEPLVIVNPKRPTRILAHPMQATQSTVQFTR